MTNDKWLDRTNENFDERSTNELGSSVKTAANITVALLTLGLVRNAFGKRENWQEDRGIQ